MHYIDDCYRLQSHLLETVEFPESHTGINISEELEVVLEEWKLSQDNLSAVTTDNESNVVSALQIAQWKRIPCFSHTRQLAVDVVLSYLRFLVHWLGADNLWDFLIIQLSPVIC